MSRQWQDKVVTPERALKKIEPGMSIFIGTALAEPRTLVKHLLSSDALNLVDLEVIQLISLGDAIAMEKRYPKKYRLKTFSAGWVASEAVMAGRVDLIPCSLSQIPPLIESGGIQIDVAFVTITPPDEMGYSSLGVAVDAAKQAMEQASVVVGEIHSDLPRTLGDTFVHMDDFDFLVKTTEPLLTFDRWPQDKIIDKVAANVATLIDDRSCLAFTTGHLYEVLAKHLRHKKDLGVHSSFFTDPVMDLVKSGAVTNRYKNTYRGKCLVSYAVGTAELMKWLDNNPLVEFQGIDVVGSPMAFASNDRFVLVVPSRKVDLSGSVALHFGKSNVVYGMGDAQEIFTGAKLSRGGRTICALPSRNLKGESNIRLSIDEFPNQLSVREWLDMVVTEYGIAYLKGRSVRERSLSLIDIAHPDDRAELVGQAKEANILYADQIYLSEAGHLYPEEVARSHIFKDNLTVRFRAIKPADEDQMRRLFYRFSDEAVYYRYFSPIKTMPHAAMQEYVNINYQNVMSVVGLVGPVGEGRIIAEARYVRNENDSFADTAFIVDEKYHRRGIASFLYELLIKIAIQRGITGFNADVVGTNKAMLSVFEKAPYPIKASLESGIYHLTIPFSDLGNPTFGQNVSS
jgi:acyl-CoA hydrolase/GNAT superfamily N-acetyltransferase